MCVNNSWAVVAQGENQPVGFYRADLVPRWSSRRGNFETTSDSPQFHLGELTESLVSRRVVLVVPGPSYTQKSQRAALEFCRSLVSCEQQGRAPSRTTLILCFWQTGRANRKLANFRNQAHHAGRFLYLLLDHLVGLPLRSISMVGHGLGCHVTLRATSILGRNVFDSGKRPNLDSLLLLGPVIEADAFQRPTSACEFHFPESAYGVSNLHIFNSRDDKDLAGLELGLAPDSDLAMGLARAGIHETIKKPSKPGVQTHRRPTQ